MEELVSQIKPIGSLPSCAHFCCVVICCLSLLLSSLFASASLFISWDRAGKEREIPLIQLLSVPKLLEG